MRIISNYGINYETAFNILVSHLLVNSIAKKFRVSVELVKLIKKGDYMRNVTAMRKTIKRNFNKGQTSFDFGEVA